MQVFDSVRSCFTPFNAGAPEHEQLEASIPARAVLHPVWLGRLWIAPAKRDFHNSTNLIEGRNFQQFQSLSIHVLQTVIYD